MSRKCGEVRVGTSGYQYRHWRKIFYPEDLAQRDWFGYYAERFDTVEINNTFYHLPAATTFDSWRKHAPTGFCYALKFSRYGSHLKKLKAPEQSIAMFLERARRLGKYLGPLLVQLPPHWHADPDRLDRFLEVAPREHRWAVEFRDSTWLCEDVYRILRHHGAALCIHDLIDDHPWKITADWTYVRFHGMHYAGDYSSQLLTAVAGRLDGMLSEGLDVYAYFNNDAEGHAVGNAASLRHYISNRNMLGEQSDR